MLQNLSSAYFGHFPPEIFILTFIHRIVIDSINSTTSDICKDSKYSKSFFTKPMSEIGPVSNERYSLGLGMTLSQGLGLICHSLCL